VQISILFCFCPSLLHHVRFNLLAVFLMHHLDKYLSICTVAADACYASGWRDKLESMIYNVTDAANLSVVLTDGPYGGGVCGATNHSHHVSLIDRSSNAPPCQMSGRPTRIAAVLMSVDGTTCSMGRRTASTSSTDCRPIFIASCSRKASSSASQIHTTLTVGSIHR
jgi:hypothetical protein